MAERERQIARACEVNTSSPRRRVGRCARTLEVSLDDNGPFIDGEELVVKDELLVIGAVLDDVGGQFLLRGR